MEREIMLRRVVTHVGLNDMEEADSAIRSVLLALTDIISHDEAHDMASELPKEYKELVQSRLREGQPVQKASWGNLVSRVQSDLDLETPEGAEQVIRGVFSVLKDAVSPGELEDVLAELPLDLREPLRQA